MSALTHRPLPLQGEFLSRLPCLIRNVFWCYTGTRLSWGLDPFLLVSPFHLGQDIVLLYLCPVPVHPMEIFLYCFRCDASCSSLSLSYGFLLMDWLLFLPFPSVPFNWHHAFLLFLIVLGRSLFKPIGLSTMFFSCKGTLHQNSKSLLGL